MRIDTAITRVFPDSIDARTKVVFNELLKIALRHARQHPDRDVLDLIARAKSIAASFDGIKK